jgi:periplasmic divalent cation tolerance protein
MISIYITFKDEKEAMEIGKHLLTKKLVACVNIFPIKSMYLWQGKIKEENEVGMLSKAPKQNFEKIKDEVKKMHSYDIPCIVSWSVEHKDEAFHNWVMDSTK